MPQENLSSNSLHKAEIEVIWSGRAWLSGVASMRSNPSRSFAESYGRDADDVVICVGCISNSCSELAADPKPEPKE